MSDETPVILYVEDDPQSRTVMDIYIKRKLGFPNLTIFENSENFIERIEALETEPDLIFLDIHMIPYTGFEMLAMLRGHPVYQNKVIIALTASVMNEEVETLKTAGFNGVISKPLDRNFPRLVEELRSGNSVWYIS